MEINFDHQLIFDCQVEKANMDPQVSWDPVQDFFQYSISSPTHWDPLRSLISNKKELKNKS